MPMSEIIKSETKTYRGITFIINKWKINSDYWKYGYELITEDKRLPRILTCLTGFGIEFHEFLFEDTQHKHNTDQTDIQRVAYLHQQAINDITKLWDIYDNLFENINKKITTILVSSHEFKGLMELIE